MNEKERAKHTLVIQGLRVNIESLSESLLDLDETIFHLKRSTRELRDCVFYLENQAEKRGEKTE